VAAGSVPRSSPALHSPAVAVRFGPPLAYDGRRFDVTQFYDTVRRVVRGPCSGPETSTEPTGQTPIRNDVIV